MKLTELQITILGAMRLKPISGIDLKRACGHVGTNRAFANALMRMRDKGLIDCGGSLESITYSPTDAGIGAWFDAQPAPLSTTRREP